MGEFRQNWVSVTTAALEDWKRAQAFVWNEFGEQSNNPRERIDDLDRRLAVYRADYRRRILSWYFKLCVPMTLGACVPNEVAELLGEEWDLATRHP